MTDPLTPPVLIVDLNRGYRQWSIKEIYATENPTGEYVPNVDDSVWDWTQGLYRVVAVDYTTGLSTLQKYTPPADAGANGDADILLGAGPGTISESYRAYLDTSVMPHTLALDKRLHIYGTTASYIKIFRGTDIGQNGEVISSFYDQNGNLLGENIPLEIVAMPDASNRAVKTPMVGYTSQIMPDGEVVTVVVYDDAGQPVSIARCLIKNTAFVRTTDMSQKYITAISVETPFLSASDPTLIEYPINMPVANLNLIGVVTYSDGTKLRMPVDGTKFSMYGLENYIATVQGQEIPLVLSYKLSPGEYSYILEPSPNKHISIPYKATTLKNDGAYSVKLFAYPVYIDALNGYRMEYYLYNLEREDVYQVTNLVQMATNSAAFNPIAYGTVQHLGVAIDLNKADPKFAAYRHVQEFDVTLKANGDDHTQDNWTVGFSPGQTPPYGEGLKAIATFVDVNNWQLDIMSGCATQAEWLDKLFYATQPLFDPETETEAPVPNFFVLQSGAHRVEAPISAWNTIITMHEAPADGGIVTLEFLRRGSTTDLQLAIAGLVVHYPDLI